MNTEQYEALLCEPCKKNIVEQTSRLTWKEKLNPKKTAKKSAGWVCAKCKKKIAKRLKILQKRKK